MPLCCWEGPSTLTAKDLGSPAKAVLGASRQAILDLLKEHGDAGLSLQKIAELLPELGASNLRMTLRRMVENGQISQVKRGIYAALSA